MTQSGERRGALDGLRGCAALIVLGSHTVLPTRYGPLGVWLFFVLSGYLLSENAIAKDGLRGWGLANYLFRRVMRIYPLYATVVLYTALIGYGMPDDRYDLYWMMQNLMLVWSDGYLWSVKQELIFYLALPFIFFAVSPLGKRPAFAALALLALALLAETVLTEQSFPITVYEGVYRDLRIAPFIIGMATAFLSRAVSPPRAPLIWDGIAIVSAVVAFGALPLLPATDLGLIRATICYLLFAALILSVDRGAASASTRVLSFAPLRLLGLVGYGFYLWHWPVICALWLNGVNDWATLFVLTIFVTAPIAGLTYLLIEKPFQRLRLPQNLRNGRQFVAPAK